MAPLSSFSTAGAEDATAPDDAALVRAIAGGDRSALAALYYRYSPILRRIALKLVRCERDAEDLVQDFFVELWRRAGDYDPGRGTVKTWLLIRLRCRAIDRLRSRSRATFVPIDDRDEVSRVDPTAVADLRRARVAIEQLRPAQRQVLELRFFEGLTTSEIAARVDRPVGTVKSRVAAALANLRRHLGAANDGLAPVSACAGA